MVNQAKRHTLDNGLTIITKEMKEIPIVSFWVWYRVGSRNEVAGITGISHWVEHMQFKGTTKLKKGEIFNTVTANGGTLNAFTWNDFTAYYETLPSDRLDIAIAIESERMRNSLFEPSEAESERTVIISEREGLENSPSFLLSEEVVAAAFKAHPYGHETIGWKSDLMAMTRDELYEYYRTYYVPNNATVVVAGDFETELVLEKIEKAFGLIPTGGSIPLVRSIEPPQIGERRVTVRHPAGTDYFTANYHAPCIANPDIFPLLVLDAVLSGGKSMSAMGSRDTRMGRSSRLYKALVDSGLTRSAGSSVTFTKDPYLFEIEAALRSGVERERIEEVAFGEVEKVQRAGVGAEELERAKKQMRAQFVYGSETVADQGYWLGHLETIDSHELYDRLLTEFERVSAEDVQRVANTYLKPENRTVGWLIADGAQGGSGTAENATCCVKPRPCYFMAPGAGQSGESAPRAVDIDIQRTELSNGVVILGHENETNPMITLRASMLAGGAFEEDKLAGLAAMVGSLLIRGTANRTFEQLNLETDSLGLSINVDTGRYMVQVGLRALSEDFPRAVELMADVLRHPIFPQDELEKLRGQVLTGLREQNNSTQVVAIREFLQMAYPQGHPFHRWPTGTEETVNRFSRDDVVNFYQRHYRPQALTVSVVGAVKFTDAVAQLQAALGDWAATGEPAQVIVPPASGPSVPQRKDIALPGKTQADVVMGLPTLPRNDPDFYALSMSNLILGRLGLMGRLGRDVRDDQGLAYYVSSDLQGGLGPSPWIINAGVNPANVQRAIDSIMREIEEWRSDLVSETEIEHAKNYLTGRLPLMLESSSGVASMLVDIEFYGLGLDYLQRYPEILRALTREQLRDAAQRWIEPRHFVTVVVGP